MMINKKQLIWLDKVFRLFMVKYLRNAPRTKEILSALLKEIEVANSNYRNPDWLPVPKRL